MLVTAITQVFAVVGGGTALGRQLAPLLASMFKKVISVSVRVVPTFTYLPKQYT